MTQAVAALRGHFILCGYGRVGSTVARELAHAGERFVVVDINPESLEEGPGDGHLVVMGDATDDEMLRAAGIERARGLDHHHRHGCRQRLRDALRPCAQPGAVHRRAGQRGGLRGEARARRARTGSVSPYTRAGRQIAELAIRPRVADFIDFALSHGELAFSIEEVEVAAGGPLAGQTVADLHRARHPRDGDRDPRAAAVRDQRRRWIESSSAGDQLIVSGTAEVLRELRAPSERPP